MANLLMVPSSQGVQIRIALQLLLLMMLLWHVGLVLERALHSKTFPVSDSYWAIG